MTEHLIPGVGGALGSYRVEAVLGRGGMGVVYRAYDERLERRVALKLLSAALSGDARFRARFLRESKMLAAIDHPAIVPVYEAGDANGQLFIAMRFVDGADLAQMIADEGPLEPGRAVAVCTQLADALDAAHARGLIHRDVKPSNALIDHDGHVYLADFGLTAPAGATTFTDAGQVIGTTGYMAPELLRGAEPSPASDLYALGCVLFECLTGRFPFVGASDAAIIYGHLELPPPRPSNARPDLPRALDEVLTRALAKDPAERWPTCTALVDAARAALAGATPARRRSALPRRVLVAAVVLAVLAGTAIVTTLRDDDDTRVLAGRTDAAILIDATDGSGQTQVELDGPPVDVAAAANAIWIADDRDGTVSRVDPRTHTIRQTIAVGHGPSALAADEDGVWAANRQDGTISFISADTSTVADRVSNAGRPIDLCLLDGGVWVAGAVPGGLLRLDAATRKRRTVPVGATPTALTCGAGSVWALSDSGTLMQVSPRTNTVINTVEAGPGASALAVGGGAVWVVNTLSDTVSRVEPRGGVVAPVISVGRGAEPVAVAVGEGGVWVANRHAKELARIDPARGAVEERLPIGGEPRALALAGKDLWVAGAATGAGHRGGTLHVDAIGEAKFLRVEYDPGTSYSPGWEVLNLTNDGLVAFRRAGGAAGTTLVPNLAETLPAPSDNGRTYTFTVRRGVRYSGGRPVRASDVKRGIERALAVPDGAAVGLLGGITSIQADDEQATIVFRLKRPDPDFLYRLTLPFAFAVPPGTPDPPTIVPASGPYMITQLDGPPEGECRDAKRAATRARSKSAKQRKAADDNAHLVCDSVRRVRLERNPAYRTWSSQARPDGYPDVIEERLEVKGPEGVEAIRSGRTDWTLVETPTKAVRPLRRRDPGLVRDTVPPNTNYVWLNTRVPPFDDADVRRAVSLAVDRTIAVRLLGGDAAARPTCHLLPPSLLGYRPDCPRRDLGEARRLVARSGTRGAKVTVWTASFVAAETRAVLRALRALGYDTSIQTLSVDEYFPTVADSRNRAQVGAFGWVADFPSPSNFLTDLFSCASFRPANESNVNYAGFCDPGLDTLMRRASRLQAAQPDVSDELWARAERRLLNAAPLIPIDNRVATFLASERLRNDQYHPLWGRMLEQAWVR
jgi:ABC-type transport system substrate-binding protein/streptogramin lyase